MTENFTSMKNMKKLLGWGGGRGQGLETQKKLWYRKWCLSYGIKQ